ncbi:MAG: phosphodiester glycosidase family protein [Clostridiales bacterium]|nr:phosphodiester glycosidase family protein [Clostridiales bacterium]
MDRTDQKEGSQNQRKRRLTLTNATWHFGSYLRGSYKTDNLYLFYNYKDILIQYNRGMISVTDQLADRLADRGLLALEKREDYLRVLKNLAAETKRFDRWPIEQIYGGIQQLRRRCIGVAALEEDRLFRMESGVSFAFADGRKFQADSDHSSDNFSDNSTLPPLCLDMGRKRDALLRGCRSVILALCAPEWFPQLREDIKQALTLGKQVYLITCPVSGGQLPTIDVLFGAPGSLAENVRFLPCHDRNLGLNPGNISWDAHLAEDIEANRTFLTVYGEEGLLLCRGLRIDSFVYAVPSCFFTRIVTNQTDGDYPCLAWVPRGFDITREVPLTERSRITYWQIARLWERYGDAVCGLTVEELYLRYPQYFLNIYENGSICPEAAPAWPIRLRWPEHSSPDKMTNVLPQFYRMKDETLARWLGKQDGVRYLSAYFDADLNQTAIPWDAAEPQHGILVHGVRLARAQNSRIIRCDGKTLRQILRQDYESLTAGAAMQMAESSQVSPASFKILSNFLFFLTPKLAAYYNELRRDRPREQARIDGGHLDYMLTQENGQRLETFPLYRKPCIAMTSEGRFLFFRYRLGGGSATIRGFRISWGADAVDVPISHRSISPLATPASAFPVIAFTPYLSRQDEKQELPDYTLAVGAGRLNLIIIQNRLVCVRQGDVLLPCAGVVISLDEKTAADFIRRTGLEPGEDGYFSDRNNRDNREPLSGTATLSIPVQIHLDGSPDVSPRQWQKVVWAYGGGLSLIWDGKSLWKDRCDGSERCDDGSAVAMEGWLCPLSRQTQETPIHQRAKHPRTAVGVTREGDLFVLVFSGRTALSSGADYQEMCRIAQKLWPDVWCMMNVDGGGSSVLGLSVNGSFLELSYPSTSPGSCAGMARPVYTALCLEQ